MLARLLRTLDELVRYAEPWAFEDDEDDDLLASSEPTHAVRSSVLM